MSALGALCLACQCAQQARIAVVTGIRAAHRRVNMASRLRSAPGMPPSRSGSGGATSLPNSAMLVCNRRLLSTNALKTKTKIKRVCWAAGAREHDRETGIGSSKPMIKLRRGRLVHPSLVFSCLNLFRAFTLWATYA